MLDIKKLEIEYVTNRAGEKTAVIVPIDRFEELIEDIEDLAVAAERREEPTVTHDQLLTELKQDGLIFRTYLSDSIQFIPRHLHRFKRQSSCRNS